MSLRVRPQLAQTGFTLTELVTVIVIAGILGAIIYNRISITSFGVNGYTSEVKSAVRYAHKLAVAQRTNIYVNVAASSVALCYNPGCTTPVHALGGSLCNPNANDFNLCAPGGVTATTIPVPFYLDSLGRPHITSTTALAASSLTIVLSDGTDSGTITIEPQTGYVH